MIHETLFYLWNSSSDVLDSHNLLELQDEFLHPGEQRLLQRIVEVAKDYHKIVAFTKSVLYQVPTAASDVKSTANGAVVENKIPPGLYTKAFCSGVEKVLEGYCQEIMNLEDRFLQNPHLSLTIILSSVERYRTLFEVLKAMIEVILNDEIHGCLLMGRLHRYVYCGMDQVSTAADQIVQSINTIFYRHLSNWIIYGNIVDVYNEFFICDGNTADDNFLYPEQLLQGEESTLTSQLFKRNRIRQPPIVRKFYINWKLVPMFVINEDTAESILFMGRIVWIVRNDPRNSSEDNKYKSKSHRDVWEGHDIDFYRKVQALECESFNASKFQETIEVCRLKLTKYLLSVMLDEGNLIEHLQLIRDYYALGRGELFQQFITVAEDQIKDIKSNLIVHNLNCIFMETARKIYGDNDKSYMRFELATSKIDENCGNPWSKLQINFEINWPLHIVFHPKVMELYNKLFCYLLKLRKTQIDLHRLWHEHVAGKQQIDRRVWTLRQNLMFLVNNLQYYLQVDVIEAQFSMLLKAIKSASEFEDIIKVHHEFISNLLAKTFVLVPDEEHKYLNKHCLYQTPAVKFDIPSKVYNIIINLLQLCDEFCLIVNTWSPKLNEIELKEFESFQSRSDLIIETLLSVLFSLHEKVNGQHLLKLVSQLDFNKFFSKKMSGFNAYTTM